MDLSTKIGIALMVLGIVVDGVGLLMSDELRGLSQRARAITLGVGTVIALSGLLVIVFWPSPKPQQTTTARAQAEDCPENAMLQFKDSDLSAGKAVFSVPAGAKVSICAKHSHLSGPTVFEQRKPGQ